ncbi:MAG TPA: extracellular solute-binding protein [Mycobacteriales bacterium]|jgi:sulfate/thiosulfate-binding protein|nr:extracellular solute-binding protein [Mycobacteriales bacterium]
MITIRSRRGRTVALLALTTAAGLGLSACGSSSSGGGSSESKSVNLVAYSVPKPAYDALATAFAKTSQGSGVKVNSSYGASGTQATAVTNGQKADVVNFSVGSDLTKLVPGKVAEGWNTGPTKGIVSDSVVVIVTRPGNPKGIKGWDDLIKPGVQIVTPDPASSGSAKWNILAAYTHVLKDGGTEDQANAYLTSYYKNIVSKPSSGSLATSTFLNGTGDVLISYESEAIGGKQKGDKFDYIVPAESFLIETPAAVTSNASQAGKDFLAYAESDAGQKIFASKGFRPALQGVDPGTVEGANDPSNPYPAVAKLTTIADLGGWTTVNKKYFDKEDGIVTKIASSVG